MNLTGLNEEQYEAVTHGEGPLLVLAGAGSGKTRVITYRIAHLITSGISPEKILALSFTNKAAREVNERVVSKVGKARSEGLTVSTFHALGLRILRQEGKRIGIPSSFTLMGEGERRSIIVGVIRDLSLPVDQALVGDAIGRWKNKGLTPEEVDLGDSPEAKPLLDAFKLYEQMTRAQQRVDFDDLLLLPLKIFRRYPDAGSWWREKYQHILVDEYQDTNRVQFELLRELTGERGNICVVGDDDQSIYGWRGAEVELILRFPEHFEGAKRVVLDKNYRSTSTILDAAHAIVSSLPGRHEKRLRAEEGSGALIGWIEAESEEEEAEKIIAHILADRFRRRRSWSSYAVLYRTNGQARALEQALRSQNLPHNVVGGTRFFDRKEVRDLVSYLRAIDNPSDDASLMRIANVPKRGLGHKTMLDLLEQSRERRLPLQAVLAGSAESISHAASRAGAKALLELLGRYRSRFSEEGVTPDNLTDFIRDARLREEVRSSYDSARAVERRLELFDQLVDGVMALNKGRKRLALGEFLDTVTLDPPEDKDDGDAEGITLMTLHAAKGLEFPVVFISGVEEGLLPHLRDEGVEEREEEERRLFYVGMTRAKEELVLSHAMMRRKKGRLRPSQPSRFLDEIPPELTVRAGVEEGVDEAEEAKMAKNFFEEMQRMLGDKAGDK